MKHTKFLGWDLYAKLAADRSNAATQAGHPEWIDLPSSRPQAEQQGKKVYFTGLECKHGHIAPRGVNKGCAGCYAERYHAI
jgi:hypothetical protein